MVRSGEGLHIRIYLCLRRRLVQCRRVCQVRELMSLGLRRRAISPSFVLENRERILLLLIVATGIEALVNVMDAELDCC